MATCSGVETSIIECQGGGDAGIWETMSLAINIFSILVGIVAVISIAVFGIQYLTSSGDPAKTKKAKRRLLEIIIGLVAYILLWTFTQWLMPGGIFQPSTNNIGNVTVNLLSENIYVGNTTQVGVKIEPSNTTNKSYTLSSSDTSIASTTSNSVRCLRAGEATITATTNNNVSGSTTIKCIKRPVIETLPDDTASSGGSSGGSNASIKGSALSESEATEMFNSMSTPTYEEVEQLAKDNYGITGDDFIAVMGWVQNEGYWSDWAMNVGSNPYLAYLSACAIINHIVENYTSNLMQEIASYPAVGGGTYGEGLVRSKAEESRNTPGALKSAYMAFSHLQPNILTCSGWYDGQSEILYGPKTVNGQTVYVW